ncbi:energy-coupling factor transporter transmembrane protein EcfT [Bordetella sp. N]|uniref:energy-coupling factor transporter transmembrane component T family protein n=1 Tax=Bordetella sp. N TaxID=1746199 RepID=UPI00070B63DE|nr:energy-coupling factor transporter transmembrane protein EcfT [Bordetella sp. N]ALM81728.1 cobalt ABC transporter [Bordetella sp. N]
MMEPLYQDGASRLHRLPAWLKLGALVLAGSGMFLVHRLDALAGALAIAALLLASTGVRAAVVWRHVRGMLLILAVLAGFTWYFNGHVPALEMVLRVAALVALALAVTMSTHTSDLIEVCERVLRPFEKLGWIDAGRAALALGLTLRFVPEIWRNYQEIREAQAARGLGSHPLAVVVPLLVRTLKRADEVADAIDARDG